VSGTFPSSPAFNSLEVNSIQPSFVSRTISGRRQARQIAGQFFTMTATFPPMTRAEFAPIDAFIMKQRGQYETFQLVLPVLSTGLGSPAGTPLVAGASQTGRSIITDGWTNDIQIFKAGDYLKFANHDKVYKVTADVSSHASLGTATIAIEPALITSPVNDSAITHTNVPFTVSLTTGVQSFATGNSGLFSFEVDFAEAL
tara:strand:+ start:289 stop:888 length:600 start_codon:yes stop_codon:yes gene_type:complete